jgi:hypothetical protein
MNAHMEPGTTTNPTASITSPSDHFEMEVCDHARKAQATTIIARKVVSDLQYAADNKYQIPAKELVELTKSDVNLLVDFIEDLENEARCLRERFYEVVE